MNYFDHELNYEQAREFRDTMNSFIEHPGWQVFVELLNTRALMREKELYQLCPMTVEQMVSFARLKGGIEELNLVPQIVANMLSDVDNQVRQYQDDMDEFAAERENENA
jgi:hypothetical protein